MHKSKYIYPKMDIIDNFATQGEKGDLSMPDSPHDKWKVEVILLICRIPIRSQGDFISPGW